MDLPSELKYSESHEWVAEHGDGTASVGIRAVATAARKVIAVNEALAKRP